MVAQNNLTVVNPTGRSLHLERELGLEIPLVFFDQNFVTLDWDIGRSKNLWAKRQMR